MAVDWIAPTIASASGVVGVVFTWLAGAQGRSHTERVAESTRLHAERMAEGARLHTERMAELERQAQAAERIEHERREAYLSYLRYYHLEFRRQRYKAIGAEEKLAHLDSRWSKADRVDAGREAFLGLQAYGSTEVVSLATDWFLAWESYNRPEEDALGRALQDRILHELRDPASWAVR